MTARFRPIFSISTKVCCLNCRTAFTAMQYAAHHIQCDAAHLQDLIDTVDQNMLENAI